MPQSRSARKRVRQNERHRLENKSRRSEIKTLAKKFQVLVEEKNLAAVKELFPTLISKLDKAARSRIHHPNTVARRKSSVARLYNQLLETSSS